MERIVEFAAGYDCVRFECVNGAKSCIPGTGGTHGRHGLSIRFLVKGDEGAVQFVIYTGWMPQRETPTSIGSLDIRDWCNGTTMPADLGYHSKRPMYDDQPPLTESCEYTDGGPCYYDGSTLNAAHAMYSLVNGGDKALWEYLEAYYEATFNGGEYPERYEYPKPERRHAKP